MCDLCVASLTLSPLMAVTGKWHCAALAEKAKAPFGAILPQTTSPRRQP